jgi:nucleoside-diphosphate-sugar epimerase
VTTVVITGAAGFIGAALAARYRAAGAQVRGIDRAPGPGIVAGDTTDPAGWAEQLAGADLVVHTAAVVSFVAPWELAWRVNVLGTARVVQAAVAAGVPRLVHLSSVAVYGFDFPREVDETYPPRVLGLPYQDTKVASEAVVLAAHARGDIDATVVRPGDVYGPRSLPWVVKPLRLLRAGRAVLPGGGRGLFAPTYIDNLVDGIVRASGDPGRGEVFTLADGISVTTGEYFGRLAAIGGGRVRTAPAPAARLLARGLGSVERAIGRDSELSAATIDYLLRTGTYSIAKARRVLGHQPHVLLDEGMARTAQWLRAAGPPG